MHMPNSKTNLSFHERQLIGGEIRLVVFNKKIEIYRFEGGLEPFMGYLELSTNPIFTKSALTHIRQAIKERPISVDSLHWLAALQNYGLLELYGEKA